MLRGWGGGKGGGEELEQKVLGSPVVSSPRFGPRSACSRRQRRGRGRTGPGVDGRGARGRPGPGGSGGGFAGSPLWPPAMRRALHGTGVRRADLGEPCGGRGGRKWALELGGRLGSEKVGGRKCRWGV